jgi:hypothetical protein
VSVLYRPIEIPCIAGLQPFFPAFLSEFIEIIIFQNILPYTVFLAIYLKLILATFKKLFWSGE